jgi:hypothetical protein
MSGENGLPTAHDKWQRPGKGFGQYGRPDWAKALSYKALAQAGRRINKKHFVPLYSHGLR